MSESPSNCVVEARSLVKRFGAVTALDGLDLSVRTGEIHGFLGPNGAGKSTTIRRKSCCLYRSSIFYVIL